MKPDPRFLNQPAHFWANVRLISQEVGYTDRQTRNVRVPDFPDMRRALNKVRVDSSYLIDSSNQPTVLGRLLREYFQYRSDVLRITVEPFLMDAQNAKNTFERLHRELSPVCPIPMNKQKGEKKAPAYFTGIINMLIEANSGSYACDYDPRVLTTVTHETMIVRTLARRVDGAFPSAINPIAVWEIKEYYYTTTFGSRVADGIYETLLDGMEIEDLRNSEGIDIKHYLMVDGHYTWWECGKSYLCRIVDILHMGFIDEVLFGSEVLVGLPQVVREWTELLNNT